MEKVKVTYMLIPNFFVVEDHSSTKTPSWVNTSTSDGDGGQVYHEHSKPDRKWSQNLQVTNTNILSVQSYQLFNPKTLVTTNLSMYL